MTLALAAGLYGVAKKQGLLDKLPTIPFLGRTGTVALVAWYWARHGGGPWVRSVATVSAVLAGYQLGAEGSITGDDTADTANGFAATADGDDADY